MTQKQDLPRQSDLEREVEASPRPPWPQRLSWWLSGTRAVTWLARLIVRLGQWRASRR